MTYEPHDDGACYGCRSLAARIEELERQLAADKTLIAEQNKLAGERQEWALHTNGIIRDLNRQLAELRADVREWFCADCNTVYPGPPQPGFACVMCPKCKGNTGPRLIMENRTLERQLAERDTQQEKDAARYRFARDVGCNFVWAVIGAGECRSGLDEAIDARIAALSAQANQEKANG